ncbi:MAG: MATE family efflux transporter [Myxococcales bacterium]|nr:MATE family efflux transporter [Myxococcales bacterium]MCB9750950.1 MATE family efflux transporter [Myxococcales bacterium]
MQDLTQGSIGRHILRLSIPIAIGMVFQTLYYLVDLYFVGQLGEVAVAGLSAAGSLQFLIMALTQALGVGTMALIAQASGRKDRADANLVFNQSLVMAALLGLITLALGYTCTELYMRSLAADQPTARAGATYLYWFLPGLGLQFALISMASALRGTGIVNPTIVVQVSTVALNALLSPIMIAGWLTGVPLGLVGAGLSTTISVAIAVVMMTVYFRALERYVTFELALIRPRLRAWWRILKVGLPPGGEFALMFVYISLVYWAIRPFGPEAQAGFGIGSRVMQAIFLPALAVAFATAPVAGQNFGARQFDRVRSTGRVSILYLTCIMLALTALCRWRPELLVAGFNDDPRVIEVGADYLRIISINFLAAGINFTNSSLFQAMGNTLPALLAGAVRLATVALPVLWLTGQGGFELRQIWWISVASATLQALLSWVLLRREFRRRLV